MEKELDALVETKVKEIFDREFDAKWKKYVAEKGDENKCAIIASKGSMDWAYPPLILAAAAAAMDMETSIYFTFYGLDIIHKEKHRKLKVSSIGNPAMPITIPSIVGMLPGMSSMATIMMKKWMSDQNVLTIPQLLEACIDGGVKMIGCQMTMDVMGVKREDLLDEIEVGGAAAFLGFASGANLTLFI
jgi:peroxiredoxin family protein